MFSFFFFNDTATTEIYTLSLHDALPISRRGDWPRPVGRRDVVSPHGQHARAAPLPRQGDDRARVARRETAGIDRKSTRLNSSHGYISYAVFCLKKKKKKKKL